MHTFSRFVVQSLPSHTASKLDSLQKEFERVQKACQSEDVQLPSKRFLERKAEQLAKFAERPMTEVFQILQPCVYFSIERRTYRATSMLCLPARISSKQGKAPRNLSPWKGHG